MANTDQAANKTNLRSITIALQARHPELVSGSSAPDTPQPQGEEWMLKCIQHDVGRP
ncbi:hypothetical protein ACFOON_09780 [Novosphingobium piscinae]|uniref:Uncharacterized protein n=1 Tax=Novosphingobium piscinae TaxID=1507448 RepID=A0A7X1G014_9SPHN|nr:hypothetical protein [Novosphingobium piscinae]MBC2670144.1 hypothetical protein [Novosphingobium piscinae]